MSKIYLINVGANTQHAGRARSPLFKDGSFEFVPFEDSDCHSKYPKRLRHFVKDPKKARTHLDPDWKHLTYGDHCYNRRARALLGAGPGDWLLFWALLWKVRDTESGVLKASQDDRRWCLIGAMKVQCDPLEAGDSISKLPKSVQRRIEHNEHVSGGRVNSDHKGERVPRVFVGIQGSSMLFSKAVDLGIYERNSLLQEVIRSANGRKLQWSRSPKWNSSTRACRVIFDSSASSPQLKSRMSLLESKIKKLNPRFRGFSG